MIRRSAFRNLWTAVLLFTLACGTNAPNARTPADDALILATTTTTYDTGLIDMLEPRFEDEFGYRVITVVGGSGQMIELASEGNADVLVSHSPDAEQEMVDRGDGIERRPVMYNDFVLIGPDDDPADVRSASSPEAAMAAIAASGSTFVSRGDDSGTHVAELRLWAAVSVTPLGEAWYDETGLGQAATLQVANQRGAYALVDRGTFLVHSDEIELALLFEEPTALRNVYHVIVVNPERHHDVNTAGGRAFAEFITRDDIQAIIAGFGAEEFGERLFVPASR